MDQEIKGTVSPEDMSTNDLNTAGAVNDPAYEALVRENQAVLGEEAQTEEAPEEAASVSQAEVESLRSQLKALEEKATAERDEMLRAVAEAVNGRRRAEADVEKARKFALEGFVKSLLPVVDALDRALALSDRDNPATKATLDGVEGTLQLFLKELSNHGVERVDPEGQPFDPNVHQAISMAESATVPANHVLHVMQPGYLLNGRVVRPAMVVVAKAPAMTQNPESGENRINVEA